MTSRRLPEPNRSLLDSPVVAGALVAVVLLLVGILFVPGLLGGAGGGQSTGGPGSSGPSGAPTAGAPTFVRPTPSPRPAFTTYTVKPGDTLSSIAREFGTTGRSIAWWNRGTYPTLDPESDAYDPNNLKVGWVLSLLPDTVVDDDNPPPASARPGATSAGRATAP